MNNEAGLHLNESNNGLRLGLMLDLATALACLRGWVNSTWYVSCCR